MNSFTFYRRLNVCPSTRPKQPAQPRNVEETCRSLYSLTLRAKIHDSSSFFTFFGQFWIISFLPKLFDLLSTSQARQVCSTKNQVSSAVLLAWNVNERVILWRLRSGHVRVDLCQEGEARHLCENSSRLTFASGPTSLGENENRSRQRCNQSNACRAIQLGPRRDLLNDPDSGPTIGAHCECVPRAHKWRDPKEQNREHRHICEPRSPSGIAGSQK